jgi:hypothetical protein
MRRALAGLAAALLLAAPLPARADAPAQVASLCADAPSGCSLRHDAWMREGSTYPVVVTGRAGVRVQVVVYAATVDDGRVTALTPVSTGGEVLVESNGVATATVTIPARTEGSAGGWALVSLGGLEGTDTSETIGAWVPFGARNPTVLGDGYGEVKPAGAVLDLHLVGTVPGSQFAVDYADEKGDWREATIDGDAANEPATRPDDVAIVRYQMPRGLAATPHAFRLRNVTAGSAGATWEATPGTKGVAEERTAWAAPGPVGERVDGAVAVAVHPTGAVRAAAAGVGAAALGATLVGAIAARRRPR